MQTQQVEKRDFLTVGEMGRACLKYWWLFVLTSVVMLSLAYVFMRKTKPLYQRSASLMIMSNRNNEEFKYSDLKIKGLGIQATKTNLKDEMGVMRSPFLMQQIVESLHLDVEYRVPGYFFNQLVYGSEVPVDVKFLNTSLSGANFKMTLRNDDSIELSDFSNSQDKPVKITGMLDDTLSTPFGNVIVNRKYDYENLSKSHPVLIVSKNLPKDVAYELLKGLTVESQAKWSDAVYLTMVDQSAERAEDILNTLMQLYDENAMSAHSRRAANKVKFLEGRVKELAQRLQDMDNGIADYKGSNLISNLESNQGMFFKDRYEQDFMTNRKRAQLADLNYIKDAMRSNMGTNKFIPTDIGIENYTIMGQIKNYNALQMERNDMAATTGENNPLVLALDRQLEIYRNTILSTVEQTVAVMQTKLDGMDTLTSRINKNMGNSARHDMHLTSTGRMHKVLAELYAYVYMQKERSKIVLSHSVSTIRILQSAYGSPFPIAPLKKQIMLMGLVAGFIFPFVFVFFRTINDDKVYTVEDLKDVQMPIIGEIPSMSGKESWKDKLLWFRHKDVEQNHTIYISQTSSDAFNESMRLLRTNLEFIKASKESHLVVMMTSAESNCGKSFISSNLAACMSLVGKKTILVDLDLRKASVSKLSKGAKQGVTAYLSYKIKELDKLICKNAFYKGVDLLPVGSIPPNPTELLQTPRFTELMSELRAKYDCVIIDCPPVDIVADDDIINVYADATLYVMRAGQTDVETLTDANSLYVDKRFKNLCAVLNGVRQVL